MLAQTLMSPQRNALVSQRLKVLPQEEQHMLCVGDVMYNMQWKKPELEFSLLHPGEGSAICQEPALAAVVAGLAASSSLLRSADLLCRDHVPRPKRGNEHSHPLTAPVLPPSVQ